MGWGLRFPKDSLYYRVIALYNVVQVFVKNIIFLFLWDNSLCSKFCIMQTSEIVLQSVTTGCDAELGPCRHDRLMFLLLILYSSKLNFVFNIAEANIIIFIITLWKKYVQLSCV